MFDGSSSMSRSGLTNSARAKASLILRTQKQTHDLHQSLSLSPGNPRGQKKATNLHPPENALVGFS
jgi:hypothetical protein